MVRPGAQGRQHRSGPRRIPEPDRQVAQPALVADAADRRATQALVELGLRPAKQLYQRGAIEAVPHLEVRLVARLGKAVPGAGELAIVAAVDPVADERAQLDRNGSLVLDRQVRDATPRVELVRPEDRLRRADVDAA